MAHLFGTDGVRGVANRDLTPDLALALGRAAAQVLLGDGKEVFVGRDTRISSPMLQLALVAGMCSAGADVKLLGVVPTPAVALLTVQDGARIGAMVSASHNPVPDNGIKFFADTGTKIAGDIEAAIEARLTETLTELPTGTGVGGVVIYEEGVERYVGHLLNSIKKGSLAGLKIVLDCAYGSAWAIAPRVFQVAGAEVITMNAEPDGSRINVDCGSTSLDGLARRVIQEGAHLGLAFDGDADRVLAVDEKGAAVDGDRIIAISALQMQADGELANDLVIGTVMANLGFKRHLAEHGIDVMQVPVGDKHVVEAMLAHGASLGGEQSGHIIFGKFGSTGDGILAGLQLASTLQKAGQPLSHLAGAYEMVPQVLINVRVGQREALEDAEALWDDVRSAEAALGEDGRVLLRPSGTEPLVRVMVEAVSKDDAERWAQTLATSVEKHLA
jgi:phosphoglucosamine mutase